MFITPAHFLCARPHIEKALLQLSPHWNGGRAAAFHPFMALEALPKLLNTMVVLLSDKGVHASDQALEGYATIHRLLQACVEYYPGLRKEVRRRVEQFIDRPGFRVKTKAGSLGDFIPLLAVCDAGWCPTGGAGASSGSTQNRSGLQ